ncbi:MAG: hypothetical protein AMXMBFR16_11070 [Candidatus Uhrbacteria bacterium]
MLKIAELVDFARSLRDCVDEGTRTRVVGCLAKTITASIQGSGDEKLLTAWHSNGKLRFVRECELLTPTTYLAPTAKAKPGTLAPFYDKWAQCNTYKGKRGQDVPITPPQNALRMAMLVELRELVDKPA